MADPDVEKGPPSEVENSQSKLPPSPQEVSPASTPPAAEPTDEPTTAQKRSSGRPARPGAVRHRRRKSLSDEPELEFWTKEQLAKFQYGTKIDIIQSAINRPPELFADQDYREAPQGYPQLARWMATDNDFAMVRQFRYLHLRVMLQLQDELRQLEIGLFRLDECDAKSRPDHLLSRKTADTESGERRLLLDQIRFKLKAYGEILLQSNELRKLDQPTEGQITFPRCFIDEKQSLEPREAFLADTFDVVMVGPGGEAAWLDRAIVQLLGRFNYEWVKVLFAADDLGGEATLLYDHARVRNAKLVIMSIVMAGLFFGPLVPLYQWSMQGLRGSQVLKPLFMQAGCTAAFAATIAASTRARRHEIFTAAASYLAVLVVFFGISPISS